MIFERNDVENQIGEIGMRSLKERLRASGAILKMKPDDGGARDLSKPGCDLFRCRLIRDGEAIRGRNHERGAEHEKRAATDATAKQAFVDGLKSSRRSDEGTEHPSPKLSIEDERVGDFSWRIDPSGIRDCGALKPPSCTARIIGQTILKLRTFAHSPICDEAITLLPSSLL